MKKLCIVLLLLVSFNYMFAQVWSENFSGEANGSTSGTATGTPGGSWSVATTPSSTFSVQNVIAVGKCFFVNDNLSEGVWQSNVITIPSPGFAAISVDLTTAFTLPIDYIRVYYKMDGGPEILFAELLGQLANATTTGSAYVSGTTVQIVMRGQDNEIGTILGAPLGFTMDNLQIDLAPVLYSRKSSTWTDVTAGNSTWSATGFLGSSCNCIPANTQVAVIGNGFTVTLPSSQNVGALSVKGTGTFTYNTNGTTLNIQQGLVRVESGGTINSSSAGITGEQIAFNANQPGAALQVDAGGNVSMQDLVLTTAATNLHYLNGAGSLTITGDIQINANNSTLTNNITTTVNSSRLLFGVGTTTTGASFINNATLTLSADLGVNDNNDDTNTITNSTSGTMNFVNVDALMSGGPANGGDLQFNNSGIINQSGTFVDIPTTTSAANSINNLAGSTWNYSGTGHDTDTRLFANNPTNNFNYALNGAQQMITPVSGDGYNNLTIQNSGAKTALSDFSVSGNWSRTGTASFTPSTFTVTFNGSGLQSISNSAGQTFNNLTLNLSAVANTVQLINDITVSNTLTLTTGGLDLNAHQLTLLKNATNAMTATANGYLLSESTVLPYAPVVWNTRTVTGTFTFPFRDAAGGNSIPIVFNKTSPGTESGTGSFSVSTFHTAVNNTPRPSGVLHTMNSLGADISSLIADRFWVITPSSYTIVPTATVTFNVAAAERPGSNPALVAQRWNSSLLLWDSPIVGQTSTSTSAQVIIPGTFSAWALSGSASPLPIELTDFEAVQRDNQIVLNWSTATELNNDFFTIERLNKKDAFDEVVRVAGKGTTGEASNYEAFDANPWEARNYYRLKQTDFDGAFTYSKIVAVDFINRDEAFTIYPNPARDEPVTIEVRNIKPQQETSLEISNLLGMKTLQIDLKADDNGKIKTTLEKGALPKGVYIVNMTSGEPMKRKIIIE